MSPDWTLISTIYVAILWLYLPILASLWLDVDPTEGLMGCLRSILWLCVKLPMDCLTSLASILWPYVCSVASEVAERACLDKEEATNVCMDAKNCRTAWAVVAILGLFIYCQFRWQRVRRMHRKRSPKKQILTTPPVHIQGSTLHKPPSKHGSWTNYWKAVTRNKVLPERCPCRHPGGRLILREGRGGNVHGAHVLFQDRLGNYYGGIVPVSDTGNRSERPIVHECDIVTVLNFGQMTFEGKLMTNKTDSNMIIFRSRWLEILYRYGFSDFGLSRQRRSTPYEFQHQFDSIICVRSGEGEPRIIVEGLVKKKRIRSTYTHHGAANRYIYQLAQAHLQQTEELNYLSREHEPKIFKFRPQGPRPQPSIWRWFNLFLRGVEDLTYLVWLILAELICCLVFGILLILLFVRFKPFSHKDSFPQQTFDARE